MNYTINELIKEINSLNKAIKNLNIKSELYHLELVECDGVYTEEHTIEDKKDLKIICDYYVENIKNYLENNKFSYSSIENCYISKDINTGYSSIYFKIYVVRGF